MSESPLPVRVRYAPSPTGALHLGGARTALFNFLFARQRRGQFLLRIEDTDRARLKPGSQEQIQEALGWLGLNWDEQPVVQSQRKEIYRGAADELIGRGAAYRCFCTPERLELMRAEQRARRQPERYDRRCATIPPEESARRAAAGEPFVVRQRMPAEGTTSLHDLVMGTVVFRNETLDDHVLEYREAGYLPEAIVNWIAFLGWSPGTEDEILSMPDLIARFSIDKVQPSPAIANLERLDWLNGQYIRRLSPDELARRIASTMGEVPVERVRPVVPLVQERLRTLADAPDMLRFFFTRPDGYRADQLLPKGKDVEATAAAIDACETALQGL